MCAYACVSMCMDVMDCEYVCLSLCVQVCVCIPYAEWDASHEGAVRQGVLAVIACGNTHGTAHILRCGQTRTHTYNHTHTHAQRTHAHHTHTHIQPHTHAQCTHAHHTHNTTQTTRHNTRTQLELVRTNAHRVIGWWAGPPTHTHPNAHPHKPNAHTHTHKPVIAPRRPVWRRRGRGASSGQCRTGGSSPTPGTFEQSAPSRTTSPPQAPAGTE